jgi:hypothetical protein
MGRTNHFAPVAIVILVVVALVMYHSKSNVGIDGSDWGKHATSTPDKPVRRPGVAMFALKQRYASQPRLIQQRG